MWEDKVLRILRYCWHWAKDITWEERGVEKGDCYQQTLKKTGAGSLSIRQTLKYNAGKAERWGWHSFWLSHVIGYHCEVDWTDCSMQRWIILCNMVRLCLLFAAARNNFVENVIFLKYFFKLILLLEEKLILSLWYNFLSDLFWYAVLLAW